MAKVGIVTDSIACLTDEMIRQYGIKIAPVNILFEGKVDRMLEIMRKKVGKSPVRVSLMHADVLEEAESLRERILSEFNCVELWLTYFSPIMGYATGRGTLVIAFQPELGH